MKNEYDHFVDWINSLKLQTLTDELKEDILEKLEVVYTDSFNEGYNEARIKMSNYIDEDM